MADKTIVKKNHKKVFKENPYDVETVFESLSIASDNNMELLYMDRLINGLRSCEDCDITSLSYAILKDLKSI